MASEGLCCPLCEAGADDCRCAAECQRELAGLDWDECGCEKCMDWVIDCFERAYEDEKEKLRNIGA